jgi:hypothetical protein
MSGLPLAGRFLGGGAQKALKLRQTSLLASVVVALLACGNPGMPGGKYTLGMRRLP